MYLSPRENFPKIPALNSSTLTFLYLAGRFSSSKPAAGSMSFSSFTLYNMAREILSFSAFVTTLCTGLLKMPLHITCTEMLHPNMHQHSETLDLSSDILPSFQAITSMVSPKLISNV
ncbi:Os02g0280850 [Oryza sativa Japonica Group]|uniref:Os02g0280850 protein n=1 Tax=Oryza sativa subsp. japonica TaxID=39947 RepID=A0A0P0VHN4_ORYSJ|nr:hypothetical protein EE612_010443 [Oryza sativa]BAS78123.1 Os02g0280850 [Oryza sativa Japonica Group]